MKRINKILFPTDFSDTAQNAFRHCLLLADEWNSKIELIHVVFPEYEALDIPVLTSTATRDKVELAEMTLKSFVELGISQVQTAYDLRHVPNVQTEVELGSPAGVINKIARRDDADLIVVGTKKEHNALERTLGSITTAIVENAPCPVIVIPEEAPVQRLAIMAYAADLSASDPHHVWQAGQILYPFHPLLHVVHVRNGKKEAPEMDFSEIAAAFDRGNSFLQIQYHELAGPSITDSLEEFVENYAVEMLVMYAPKHSLLDKLFRQSHTRQMALETTVPLLILK